jgi:hypothetical protein
MRISRLFKQLQRWSSRAFRKRHSPAAFRTCRNAANSVLTAEGTTAKGTGGISCEVEFCFLQTQSQNFTDKGCSFGVCHPSVFGKSPQFYRNNCITINTTFLLDLHHKTGLILLTKLTQHYIFQ